MSPFIARTMSTTHAVTCQEVSSNNLIMCVKETSWHTGFMPNLPHSAIMRSLYDCAGSAAYNNYFLYDIVMS